MSSRQNVVDAVALVVHQYRIMTLSLPSSAPFVKLHALLTGRLQLPERWLFEDGDDDVHRKREDSPVFSFLIEHPSGKRVLFDLGLRKVSHPYNETLKAYRLVITPELQYELKDMSIVHSGII